MKFTVLKEVGENNFPKMLRKLRLEKGWSKSKLGKKIGRTSQQIQRYEVLDEIKNSDSKQRPTMDMLKKICLLFQISADDLLGLEWVETNTPPEYGVIYEWKLERNALYWICPNCNRKNITYNDFVKDSKLIAKQQFICEFDDCSNFYEHLKDGDHLFILE